jgi:secreted trypsin-like serine protease
VLAVSAVVVHPKFSLETMRYDAALLVLDRAVTGVPIVPLATASPAAGTKVNAAGWGKTAERATSLTPHLRSVALEIAPTRECRRGSAELGEYFPPSMLCASAPGRDTCAGDSGGPLVATSNGHVVLVGVTSFGVGCARAGHPGVYTRASAIRAWTDAQLALVATAFPAAA